MLQNRTVTVQVEGCNLTITTSCGLPQGGGLSPLLWSVVADSLLQHWLSRQHVFAQGYADDDVVVVCGISVRTICDIMQRLLHGIERWCIERSLSVNPIKTEMVLFTRRYKPDKLKTISFFGQPLHCGRQVKYLGVILDPKLNWKLHVDAKCTKALTAFCILRRMAGMTWSLSPWVIMWLYAAVIRLCSCRLVDTIHLDDSLQATRTYSKTGVPLCYRCNENYTNQSINQSINRGCLSSRATSRLMIINVQSSSLYTC